MTTLVYPALAKSQSDGGYVASFPDIPGAGAAGADLAALLIDARARLLERLTALEADGEAWPAASSLESLPPSAGALLLVDIEVDDPPARVNISIGERLLKRIDQAASAGGMTRSGFIAQAARGALGDADGRTTTDKLGAEWESVSRRLQEELSTVGRKLTESLGPDSPFSRNMADLDHRLYERIQKAADAVSSAMAKRRAGGEASADGESPPH